MKFVYGRQDFKDFERSEENCYLLTNGLGGFSSMTMAGSCSRNDHSLLMACKANEAPNHRYNMIHRLSEILYIGQRKYHLSTQNFIENNQEEGYRYLSSFIFDEYPMWLWELEGVAVSKKIVMFPGENTIGISYEIENTSGEDVLLQITPQLQFVPKGRQPEENKAFQVQMGKQVKISSDNLELYLDTDGEVTAFQAQVQQGLRYVYDEVDGRNNNGRTIANHKVEVGVSDLSSKVLNLVYSTEPVKHTVAEIERTLTWENQKKMSKAGLMDETANALVLAADQFIAKRASTGGNTILAGFPFFEDWGRDTMISLAGCCITTGRYRTARSILRTFSAYCKDGLMPNLFPEGEAEPMYNTADASLLFIVTLYTFYMKTGKLTFVEEMWPTMCDIVENYAKGTDYHIYMDSDGLICAGGELEQVTWMDVRIGDILPTPRHGKPVEINAYWYNALRIMDFFGNRLNVNKPKDYAAMAEKCRQSFREKFWIEEQGYLKDVVSGGAKDNQLRCNQIWVVSLPFSLLTSEEEKKVVLKVYRHLYTPLGLRTLSPLDTEFHPLYGGELKERDLAYHQGTVWAYPLGAYYIAYLKVNGYSNEAKARVRKQLNSVTAALREGCIGQLPEIYDGERPISSKGCFAQAWSVGEILRVYEALER